MINYSWYNLSAKPFGHNVLRLLQQGTYLPLLLQFSFHQVGRKSSRRWQIAWIVCTNRTNLFDSETNVGWRGFQRKHIIIFLLHQNNFSSFCLLKTLAINYKMIRKKDSNFLLNFWFCWCIKVAKTTQYINIESILIDISS